MKPNSFSRAMEGPAFRPMRSGIKYLGSISPWLTRKLTGNGAFDPLSPRRGLLGDDAAGRVPGGVNLGDRSSLQPAFAEDLAGRLQAPADERRDLDELDPTADQDPDRPVDPALGAGRWLLRYDLPPFIAVVEFDPLLLERQSLPGEVPLGLGQSFPRDVGYRDDFPFLDDTGRKDRAGEKDDQENEEELAIGQDLFAGIVWAPRSSSTQTFEILDKDTIL